MNNLFLYNQFSTEECQCVVCHSEPSHNQRGTAKEDSIWNPNSLISSLSASEIFFAICHVISTRDAKTILD